MQLYLNIERNLIYDIFVFQKKQSKLSCYGEHDCSWFWILLKKMLWNVFEFLLCPKWGKWVIFRLKSTLFIFCLKVFISFYSQIIPDDWHDSVQKRLFRTLNENSCYAWNEANGSSHKTGRQFFLWNRLEFEIFTTIC